MNKTLAWGILGTGRIARRFAYELPSSQTGQLYAVGSRTQAAADAFAEEFKMPAAYGRYEALLADPKVEAIYISLPNHLHAEWAIRCAEAGKHILCEKPLTTNHPEAMTVIEAARANDVFLMEAFMYRCHPQIAKMQELIRSGTIGDVRLIQAYFSYNMGGHNDDIRLQNDLAGGGIMDVGCYPVSVVRLIAGAALGKPFANPVIDSDGYGSKMALKAYAHIGEQSNVDEWATATLKFDRDILAEVACGLQLNTQNFVAVWGSKGHLLLRNPWLPDTDRFQGGEGVGVVLHRDGSDAPEEIPAHSDKPLYAIEADTIAQYLAERQAPSMSWGDTLGNMLTLDAWRREIGLVFGNEKYDALSLPFSRRPLARAPKHNMQYGRVPGIDKPVSRLVMGTMIFKDDRLPLTCSLLDYFYEQGGTCFDTAHVYRSEKAVGQWLRLRGVREEMVIIGKGARDEACTAEGINAQLAETLETMQLDYLDMYMMHSDRPATPVGELVECLNEHLRAGRIRSFGGSNWSTERIEAANAYAREHNLVGFAASSPNLSLAAWNEPMWPGCLSASDAESRTWYAKSQMPLFAWSSQATGFFTGRYQPTDSTIPSLAPIVRTWFKEDNWVRLQRARDLAARKGVTAAQIALAYVLSQPFPVFALIGPQSIDELREVQPALDIHLSPAEMSWLNLENPI
jgi:predicted dehydrogenase/aryl-alcohol dehydrogenase-like predicted oxidoreductase